MFPALPVGAEEVKTVFDAKEDISKNQGENNWYYRRAGLGQFELASYTDMDSFQDPGDWYDTGTNFILRKDKKFTRRGKFPKLRELR